MSCLLLHLTHLDGLGVQDDEGAGEGHVGQGPEDEVDHVGGEPPLGDLLPAVVDKVGDRSRTEDLTAVRD